MDPRARGRRGEAAAVGLLRDEYGSLVFSSCDYLGFPYSYCVEISALALGTLPSVNYK